MPWTAPNTMVTHPGAYSGVGGCSPGVRRLLQLTTWGPNWTRNSSECIGCYNRFSHIDDPGLPPTTWRPFPDIPWWSEQGKGGNMYVFWPQVQCITREINIGLLIYISLLFLSNISHVEGPVLPPDNGYPPLLSHRGYHGVGTSPWHSTWDYLSKIAYETIWEVLSISQSVLSFLEPDNPMVKCLDPHWVPPGVGARSKGAAVCFPALI